MRGFHSKPKWYSSRFSNTDRRILILESVFLVMFFVILYRLAYIQIANHSYYSAMAAGQYEMYKDLLPKRGNIFLQNTKLSPEERYNETSLTPIATNREYWRAYAVPYEISDARAAAQQLTAILFSREDEEKEIRRISPDISSETLELELLKKEEEYENVLFERFRKEGDPYEPIAGKIDDETKEKISALGLKGIALAPEPYRYYPQESLGSHIVGFVGEGEDGKMQGLYGLEHTFEEQLAGVQGYLKSEKDGGGRMITLSESDFRPAIDGASVILTIDDSLQHFVCQKLNEAVPRFEADGGSIIVVSPKTGAVLAMCGYPDFDPNVYREVKDISTYNNPATFNAFEPGSIFKPFTMAAGLDLGRVEPDTTYEDKGQIVVGGRRINNFDGRAHGVKTMVDVIKDSLNLGSIFVVEQVGKEDFKNYVRNFSFGTKTGIELPSEAAGDVSQLDNSGVIYTYTASFGQGITVTPLQMVTAFSAFANRGVLVEPHIVDRIVFTNGTVEVHEPKEIRQVVSERTAKLIGSMLITAVEEGHAWRAQVPGYLIGGKTGTAQVAEKGEYGENTIHSFVGFGPVDAPVFVAMVRLDHPRKERFAETTAVAVFGEVAKFLLNYYQVPTTNME